MAAAARCPSRAIAASSRRLERSRPARRTAPRRAGGGRVRGRHSTSAATGSASAPAVARPSTGNSASRRACRPRSSRCRRARGTPPRRAWRRAAPRAPRSTPAPWTAARDEHRLADLRERGCPASFEADPSTPRPTVAPASSSARAGAMPAPSRRFELGHQATPAPDSAIRRDVLVVEVHAVREPHVVAEPAPLVHQLERAPAEPLAAVALLLERLGEMRVQPHAEPARELGATRASAARSRRTASRARRAIRSIEPGDGSWKPPHRLLGRGEDLVGVLDHLVGRQPAVRDRPGPSTRGDGWNRIPSSPRGRDRRPRARRLAREGTGSGDPWWSCSRRARARRAPRAPRRAPTRRPARPTPGRARRASRTDR